MDLALRMVNFDYPGGPETITAVLAEVGQAVESAGIINLSVMDHYLQMEAPGRGRRCSRATRRWGSWPHTPSRSHCSCWSPESRTGTRGCS
jgi:hypothetical protein